MFGRSNRRRRLAGIVLAAVCGWAVAPLPQASAAAPDGWPSTGSAAEVDGAGIDGAEVALSAILLPSDGDADASRLAVRWSGDPGAELRVTLRSSKPDAVGSDSVLVPGRALTGGANLVDLPLAYDASGALRLLVRDRSGALRHDSERRLDGLRQSSGLGSPAEVAAAAPGLYAGGTFTRAGGTIVDHLGIWNGSAWSEPGGSSTSGPDGSVTALTVYDGDLIAGGSFLTAGGVRVNGIARWDGTAWSPLTGSSGTGVMTAALDFVDALAVFDGDLIVGGQFLRAGGVPVNHIARWDGTEWSALTGPGGTGLDVPSVWDLAVHGGALIVAGGFSQAGGAAANRIARWTGSAWSTLGTGFNGDVLALTVFDGVLVATGGFTQAGGTAAAYVAGWNGSAWSALGGGLNAEGRALTVHDGALVVGGTFTQAGGIPVNYVARWSGTAWSALAGPSGVGTEDIVLALAVYGGRLVAGGFFTQAGGLTVSHVAGWDGTAWSALTGPSGAGTDAAVYVLRTV